MSKYPQKSQRNVRRPRRIDERNEVDRAKIKSQERKIKFQNFKLALSKEGNVMSVFPCLEL